MEYRIRKAESGDRHQIARTIAYSLEKDYSGITKDMDRFAKALENGIDVNRFIYITNNDILLTFCLLRSIIALSFTYSSFERGCDYVGIYGDFRVTEYGAHTYVPQH